MFLTTSGYLANRNEGGVRYWGAYERWMVSRAWRIAQSGDARVDKGQMMLVELDEAVADTLIHQEELVLSAADEVSVMTSNVEIDLITCNTGFTSRRRRLGLIYCACKHMSMRWLDCPWATDDLSPRATTSLVTSVEQDCSGPNGV